MNAQTFLRGEETHLAVHVVDRGFSVRFLGLLRGGRELVVRKNIA